MKTILIHNGATPEGIELIKKLLAENDLKTNNIKNKVICIDEPAEACKLQEFLSQDEFTFYALDPTCLIDINENISKVIIMKKHNHA